MSKWFQTWNREEYQEWATEIPEGYLLAILRKEPSQWLCVKAKLIMGERGLPDFKVFEEAHFSAKKEALEKIQTWQG